MIGRFAHRAQLDALLVWVQGDEDGRHHPDRRRPGEIVGRGVQPIASITRTTTGFRDT